MNLYAILEIIDAELIELDFQIATNLANERQMLVETKFRQAALMAANREGLVEGRIVIEDIRREIANSEGGGDER